MKIGISTSVVQRGRTGIAQYLFALLRAFAMEGSGHEFTLFVLEEDRPLFEFISDRMQIVIVPERFRPAVRNILWHQFYLPRLARKLRLDVLHVPSYRRLVWNAPCATVATIHDLAPFKVAGKYDYARMFYGRVVVKRIARRQTGVIAISQNTAADINQFIGLDSSRITTVHNGLEHERFRPEDHGKASLWAEQKWNLKSPFFLYVARLEHPGKNHVRLISAFNQFKNTSGSDWQLVLGGSNWHGAEAIHQAISTSPFASDIRSLGFVSNEDLPNLYRAASIFVYPSLYEGFGLPPIEAMACGCPVVASDRGSLAEVIGDAALVVDPEDVSDMKSKLARVAAEPDLRARLRAAGLERAQSFNWNKTARATLDVYVRAVQKVGQRETQTGSLVEA
jgi:glycosyltransferase involved in cell wall biosynthesis